MTRNKLATLLVAGSGLLIGIATAGCATNGSQGSQAIGDTSGATASGALVHRSASRSAEEATYLNPHELRTPSPRDSID